MARGGPRPGSGRKVGSVTKRTRAIAEGALKDGLTPLEYMLGVMRDPNAPSARRDEMAKSAAPYLHPRLQTMTIAGDADRPVHFVARLPSPAADSAEWERSTRK